MNREQLQDIFRQPYNAQTWQGLLINLFGASEIRRIPSTLTSDSNEKVEGFQLGTLTTTDRYEIGLFAFEIKGGMNLKLNRVGLRSLVRSYTRYNVDAALVVYYDVTHWRLSFICDIKEQKTATKRYTYVFGNPNESYRTASAMLAKLSGDAKLTFDQIKAAFSVEALSKDFFKGYKERYVVFCKNVAEQSGREEKWQRDYVKKMMGRLVFLQFLQKKGWMGVPANQKDWEGGNLQYTQKLIKQYSGNDKLLSEILEPLFFDTLNTKREGDIADPKLGNNIKIPYLNGGLFDKDKLDEKEIDFPYVYFAELMDFFSQYNFTIDENDPNDAEVGIDPEMLGHIFENLLEDNKDKGAFYTPKEIVQYMCRQSLIEYLQSKLGKHTEIEDFINNHDTGNRLDGKNYIAANAKAIEELLDCVKICDPAIGSGAFPMGVLSEIFQAKMALDMTLDRAAVKKNIIQNSIYGVDIEQGAVDIARLRFWLSLVVDEDEPQPLPNLDYKIMCGNSLLSRYELNMPFDDVFKEYNKGKSNAAKMSLGRYRQLVADYTNTSDHTQKAAFRKTIEEIKSAFRTELSRGEKEKFAKLKGQIIDLEAPMLFGERTKQEKDELKKLKAQLVQLEKEQADIVNNKLYEDAFEWRFEFPQLLDDDGRFVGFDIVIANPPYVDYREIDDKTIKGCKLYKLHKNSSRPNLFLYFIELAINIMNEEGNMTFINPTSLLSTDSAFGIRNIMINNCSTNYIIDISNLKVFDSASTYVIVWSINMQQHNNDIRINKCNDIESLHETTFTISVDSIKEDKKLLIPTNENSLLIAKLESNNKQLGVLSVLKWGTSMTGYGKLKVIKSTLEELSVNDYAPIVQTADIKRYSIEWKGEYIPKSIYSQGIIKEFEKEKLLIARVTKGIQATFDGDYHYVGKSTLITDCQINALYLLAIINSKLINFWYLSKFDSTHMAGGYVRFDIPYLKQIPIKDITKEAQQPFIDLVDEILAAKKADQKADTTALEAQIDQMIYALYNLTPDEIAIIEK